MTGPARPRRPRAVFSDLDGTLTDGGLLAPALFDVLSLLAAREVPLVVATGRSASWAAFLLTYLPCPPLVAVVAEGGGVVARRRGGGADPVRLDLQTPRSDVDRLEALCARIRAEHPDLPFSADSLGRLTDRAFDLDDYLGHPRRARVDALLAREGARAVQSNVHLNFWFGGQSKARAARRVLEEDLGGLAPADCLFFGDSANDESMFRDFPASVGVANIAGVLDSLDHRPAVVLEGASGEGARGVLAHLKAAL